MRCCKAGKTCDWVVSFVLSMCHSATAFATEVIKGSAFSRVGILVVAFRPVALLRSSSGFALASILVPHFEPS